MNVFDLQAKIGLDTTGYTSGLKSAGSKMASLGKSVAKFATGTMAAGTAAVTAFGVAAVKTGMEFDSAMSQVASTSGKTMEEMSKDVGEVDLAWGHFSGNLRDYAQEMGANTAFSATQAAEALNYMALAGYDTQTSMEMLPNVLNLAAAGGMELATASDMITDTQSALGLSLEETTKLVDKMAKGAATTNTSVEQLGSALLTVGGTAKDMAGGTTEMAQVLGVLADNGIKGAEGGTALRNILLGLTPKSKAAAKAMEKIGFNAFDANGNLRPLQDTFEDMGKAMEGMSTKDRQRIIKSIFNKADLKSVNALLGTSKKRWNEVASAIDDSEGAAQQMADTQLDNLKGDVTLLKSAWEGLQIAISDGASPELRNFVQFASKSVSDLTKSYKTGGLEGFFAKFGDIVGQALKKIQKVLPDLVKVGGEIITGLIDGLLENPDDLADGAISILDTFLDVIFENLPKLINAGSQMLSSLLDSFTEGDSSSKIAAGAIGILESLANALIKNVPKLLIAGTTLLSEFITQMTTPDEDGTTKLFDGFKALFEDVDWGGIWDAVWDLIGAAFAGSIHFTADVVTDIVTGFGDWWDSNVANSENGKTWGENLMNVIGEGAAGVTDWIGKYIAEPINDELDKSGFWDTKFGSRLSSSWDRYFEQEYKKTHNPFETWVNGLKKSWDDASLSYTLWFKVKLNQWGLWDKFVQGVNFSQNAKQALDKFVKETIPNWVNAGKEFIEGLKKGIVEAITNISTWLYDHLGKPVIDAVKSIFKIGSPSKVFEYFGKMDIAGLKKGWSEEFPSFLKMVNNDLALDDVDLGLGIDNGVYDSVMTIEKVDNPQLTYTQGLLEDIKSMLAGINEDMIAGIDSVNKRPLKVDKRTFDRAVRSVYA